MHNNYAKVIIETRVCFVLLDYYLLRCWLLKRLRPSSEAKTISVCYCSPNVSAIATPAGCPRRSPRLRYYLSVTFWVFV